MADRLQESDLPIISRRLAAWDQEYYAELASLGTRYLDDDQEFAGHLAPKVRRTELVVTPEVCVASTFKSDLPEFLARWSTESIEQLTDFVVEYKAPNFTFEFLVTYRTSEAQLQRPERVRVFRDITANAWSLERARERARADAAAFTVGRFLNVEVYKPDASGQVRDPKLVVAERLRQLISAFESLLDDVSREEDLHAFLVSNPWLLEAKAVNIQSKVRLGTEYVTDFVIELPTGDYVLVEIERANHNLYTAGNNPTAALTHAVQQVEDWLEWCHTHGEYLRSSFPRIHEPQGLVVIGRRGSLNSRSTKALRRRNASNKVRVMTYDDLLDGTRALADMLERWK